MQPKYDLSVLIPARHEEFLYLTVKNILENIRGKTEVIVALDGQWANPSLPQASNLTIIYFPESLGQRAATNQACRLSRAKYVMKIDAHCAVDEGFDQKMLKDMQDNWTMIPTLYNLHMFDWVCERCQSRQYQGPSDQYKECPKCHIDRQREIIFQPRFNRKSLTYRFDKTLHFQYWGELAKRQEGDIIESMSAQGSCFLLTRERYWALDICDEGHGSWGQQGTEVACKTWLSGGRLVTTKKTWYSHMFRTQGGDFGFPYALSGSDVHKARQYSQKLWLDNTWPLAIHDLQWLLAKFAPIPDWHDASLTPEISQAVSGPTKGCIFYTDNQVNLKIAKLVQRNLASMKLPIVSTSLKPMDHFGYNIHVKMERGYLAMFTQILTALKASTSDIIFMCEHDVIYHKSHFDFTPPDRDKFYYNINVWKVDPKTGHALWVDVCQQVSGLAAYRELLIDEYEKRVKFVTDNGFQRSKGFEPGTKSVQRGGFSDRKAENFKSAFPNIDIRYDHNLTPNRWTKEEFRNQKNTEGWTESTLDQILGWQFPRGNFLNLP